MIIVLYHPATIQASPGFVSEASDPFPWGKVELWESALALMQSGQESLLHLSLPANDKVQSWFPSDIFIKDGGSSSYEDYDCGDFGHLKSNKYFLLGYGTNWSSATKSTPVLLVHGAADEMNRAWAHPWEKNTPTTISQTGLLQYLNSREYAVFAISFPHTQGNNLIQA